MSKFFADDSDENSEHDSNESDNEKKQELNQRNTKREQIMEELGSSEEEEKHVVVSEKDKRVKLMKEIVDQIHKKEKINDFVGLLTHFEELNKELEKGKKMFEKEGGIPRFYIRLLCQLENFILGVSAEEKKKFSQTNNKSYNALKQRIKKHNLGFKTEIDSFLSNPIDSEAEKEEEKQKKQQEQPQEEKEAQDDDDDDEDENDEDDEDEEEDDDKYLLQSNDPMVRRRYWLKKVKDEKDTKENKKDEREERQKQRLQQKQQEKQIDYEIKFQIQEAEDIKIDFSNEGVNRQLQKIVDSRGRTGGQHQNIYICEKMIQHFTQKNDLKRALEILVIVVQLQIDQAKSEGQIYIARKAWHHIYQNILLVVSFIHNENLQFDQLNTYSKYDFGLTRQKLLDTVQLNFATLESELNKAFVTLEYNLPEYSERLSDLYQLIFLAQKLLGMFEKEKDLLNIAKISYRYIELCYFLSQPLIDKIKASAAEDASAKNTQALPSQIFSEPIQDTVSKLVKAVYSQLDEDQMRRATLYQIYNLSLHGKFIQSRDLLQLTFPFETISSQKLTMQVHYNRAIIMLGLAAFRQGFIVEAHSLLGEFIITRDRFLRDLLAQNYTKAASETEAAKYNVAYHLSINLEVVETVYYICAMLLELPNINQDQFEDQQKTISRKFRQFYTHYEAQPFNNITDNFREIIYNASKNLSIGNWKNCYETLLTLQIWSKIHNSEEVQAKLLQKIKESALKCYLLNFKQAIASINLSDLEITFLLEQNQINSIVFKMVYYRELNAKIEGNGRSQKIIFRKQPVNTLNRNIIGLIDKINGLSKTNEKILDAKYGSYGFQQAEKVEADQKGLKSKSKKKPTKYKTTKNITKTKKN